jgi:hypothetical protein
MGKMFGIVTALAVLGAAMAYAVVRFAVLVFGGR